MSWQPVENLQVWVRSKDLAVAVYRLLKSCRDYGLKDQMTRAAVSVPSNIAEGYERHSAAEKRHFYRISKGSVSELRTQLIIAAEVGEASGDDCQKLVAETKEISAMLQGLIRSVSDE